MSENIKNTNYDDIQSKTIDALRFPLILGIVIVHSYIITTDIGLEENSHYPAYYYITELFSQVIGRICIPLYLFISGYLFFYKASFSVELYKCKLKSRVKTLLIPYLLWNIIAFICLIVYLLIKHKEIIINIQTLITVFWAGERGTPIDGPLWFIRDLIVLAIISPLIYYYIRYTKFYGLLLLLTVWLATDLFDFSGYSNSSLLFYSLGAFFSLNNRNFTIDFKKFYLLSAILYSISAIVTLITKDYAFNTIMLKVSIIIGITLVVNIASGLVQRGILRPNRSYIGASFFIYAVHTIYFLPIATKVLNRILEPANNISLLIMYLLTPITVVTILFFCYYVMQKCLPGTTKILIGGR